MTVLTAVTILVGLFLVGLFTAIIMLGRSTSIKIKMITCSRSGCEEEIYTVLDGNAFCVKHTDYT